MRFLGAKVVLTPAPKRATGMVQAAEALAAKHGWFLTRQFDNPANPAYHRNTTGPEILSDFADRRLDYYVSGYGTGGTITGAGQMIRLARPEVKIISEACSAPMNFCSLLRDSSSSRLMRSPKRYTPRYPLA